MASVAKKKDRTGAMTAAVLAAVLVSAYGFGENDPVLAWMVPLGIAAPAIAWAFWPRPGERTIARGQG